MIAQYADTVMLASKNFDLSWFGWIVIGGLAGWIASMVMGTNKQMGIVKNVVAGIVGGWLGGFVLRMVFDTDTKSLPWFYTFLTALVGAIVVIGAVKLVTGRKG